MRLEAIPFTEGHAEKCVTCGSCVQRQEFGEMYAGASILNGERVEIRRKPRDGFANPIYLDPLTIYFDGGLYRKWPKQAYFSRGGKLIHREVWRDAFGAIPDGCHINHKDYNTANNNLEVVVDNREKDKIEFDNEEELIEEEFEEIKPILLSKGYVIIDLERLFCFRSRVLR
jgi:hypothetical protein